MEPLRLQFTQAKARLSEVFDDVLQHHAARVIERQKSAPVVLLERDALAGLLAEDFPFTTQMSRADDGTVSIWLDQFDIYGRGRDIPAALEDLLDEVEAYVEEWEEELHRAPNHADREWWVRRIQLAEGRDEVRSMLFPVPDDIPTPGGSRPDPVAP